MRKTIHSLFISASLLVSLCAFTSSAHADFKVATIDINKVLNDAPEAKNKRKELEAKADVARKKLEDKRKALQDVKDKLEKAKADPDSKEVAKFRGDVRDFERMAKDSEDDIKREFVKFNKDLADRAVKVISSFSKSNNIDLVLDKSERGRSLVLFGQDSFDITEKIVQEMNKN